MDRGIGRVSHSTPLVVPGPQGDELVVNSSERIDAYDPPPASCSGIRAASGRRRYPPRCFTTAASYLSRGYRNSDYMAIRPGGSGDITKTHVEWQAASGASYVPSILYYDGLLYMTNEVGVVTCADARTGEPCGDIVSTAYSSHRRLPETARSTWSSETGETFVLRAGRRPEVLSRNELGERLLASPAILRGGSSCAATTRSSRWDAEDTASH